MSYLSNNLFQASEAAERMRLEIGAKALRYYDGLEPDKILAVKPGGPDDNIAVNYAETIVDKGVSFLFGEELGIEIGSESDTSGEAYLEEVWPMDARSVDLVDLATNGGIFGHAWLKIALSEGRPAIYVLDSQNMSAEWDKKNYKRVIRYRNQYNTTDENNQPIIWREDTDRDGAQWVINEYQSKPDKIGWTLISSTPWPYEFAPVFECKNLPKPNEFYGRADLSRYVLALIFYLARVDSLINKIIRAHASPKPVAKGLKSQDLKIGTDDILFLPNLDQQIELLEMSGDLRGAMDFRKLLREGLSEVSHVPEVATGKLDSIGQLSGLALKILYGPLLDQTIKKRRLYGKLVKDAVSALLAIGGKPGLPVSLRWQNPMPSDEAATLNNALVKKQIGVSSDTLLQELGYDPDEEKVKRQADIEETMAAAERAFNRGNQGDEE
jgi:hypothetical protein